MQSRFEFGKSGKKLSNQSDQKAQESQEQTPETVPSAAQSTIQSSGHSSDESSRQADNFSETVEARLAEQTALDEAAATGDSEMPHITETLNTDLDATQQDDTSGIQEEYFWVANDDYFRSTLIVIPAPQDAHNKHVLTVFSFNGEKLNELVLKFPPGKVGIFDLDAVTADAPVSEGHQQVQIKLQSVRGARHSIELNNAEGTLSAIGQQKLDNRSVFFSPLQLAAESKNYLVINNQTAKEGTLRCRLITGSRSPETEIRVPADGVRIIYLETEFSEYLDTKSSTLSQGYIRVTTYENLSVSINLLSELLPQNQPQELK